MSDFNRNILNIDNTKIKMFVNLITPFRNWPTYQDLTINGNSHWFNMNLNLNPKSGTGSLYELSDHKHFYCYVKKLENYKKKTSKILIMKNSNKILQEWNICQIIDVNKKQLSFKMTVFKNFKIIIYQSKIAAIKIIPHHE